MSLAPLPTREAATSQGGAGNRIALVLAITGLLVALWLVRVAGVIRVGPIQGGFSSYFIYGVLHAQDTGVLPDARATSGISPYATGLSTASELAGLGYFQAFLLSILGDDAASKLQFLTAVSWPGVVLLPFAVLTAGALVAAELRRPLTPSVALTLVAFGASGSYWMMFLTNNGFNDAAFGFALILLCLGCLSQTAAPLFRLLAIIFGCAIPLFYHTAALVFLISLTCIVLLVLLTSVKGNRLVSVTFLALNAVFTIAYWIYFTSDRFTVFARILPRARFIFEHEERHAAAEIVAGQVPVLYRLSYYAGIVCSLFLALLIIIALIHARSAQRSTAWKLAVGLGVSLAPVAVGLYLWLGTQAVVARLDAYGTLTIAFGLIFVLLSDAKMRRLGIALTAGIVVFGSVAYLTSPLTSASMVEWSEWRASEWIVQKLPPEQVVFTDLRLSSAIFVNGKLDAVGISDGNLISAISRWSRLLGREGAAASRAELATVRTLDRRPARYALLSRKYESVYPAVVAFDFTLRVALPGFIDVLSGPGGFERLYDNGTAVVLHEGE